MIKEYYHDIDMNANQLFNSRLHNITTAARIILGGTLSTSDKGYMVYDTNLSSPYFWDGTQWLAAGGGGGAVWGAITGTLTAQTDLTAYLAANYYPLLTNPAGYLTATSAGLLYYPLSSNPAGYLTTETDPVFSAWLATPPNVSVFTNDAGYLTGIPTLQQVTNVGYETTNPVISFSVSGFQVKTPVNQVLATLQSNGGQTEGQVFIADTLGGLSTIYKRTEITAGTNSLSFPNATGTFALSVNGNSADSFGAITIPVGTGTVTSVTATSPLFSSGGTTPNITIQQASGSQDGYLSSGDWTTFNSKLGGSGTTNSLSKWSSASSLTNSQITDNGTVVAISNWLQFENNSSGYTGYGRIYNFNSLVIGGVTNYSDTARPYITLGVVGGNNMTNGTTFIQNSIGDVGQTSGTYVNTKVTGRVLSFSGNAEHRFLTITPSYDDNGSTNTYTGTIRGVYYNLTKSTPFPAGASNIAWENVNGDIIHGNLATGGVDEMVTVDTSGKLKKQAIPTGGGSVGFEMNFMLMGA